jgi:diaminopimelate decarboxylase
MKGINPLNIEDFVTAVSNCFVADLKIEKSSFELVTDPGRTLVEDYGYLISSVAVNKRRADKEMVVMDAGGNLVRSITGWFHPVESLDYSMEKSTGFPIDVYGANCFETDLLCADWVGPNKLERGSRLIFGSAGGYDIPSANIWTRPLPTIFGKYNNTILVIRENQVPTDMRSLQIDLDKAPSVSL